MRLIQYNFVFIFKLQIKFVPFKIVPFGGHTSPETFPLFIAVLEVANRSYFLLVAPTLHLKGELLPDCAIRRQSQYFIYRPGMCSIAPNIRHNHSAQVKKSPFILSWKNNLYFKAHILPVQESCLTCSNKLSLFPLHLDLMRFLWLGPQYISLFLKIKCMCQWKWQHISPCLHAHWHLLYHYYCTDPT
jgi:hypothetical protein